ncbi:MAG: AAA family ATPase [Verrucomicrobiota bacterium]
MTINISKLRDRIEAGIGFSEVEQVSESILRAVRKAGDLPFAVYYFDIAQHIPTSKEILLQYQDTVIGSRYFDGQKSLQWNNYLYFITSKHSLYTEEFRKIKSWIERDRSYARKFIITELELEIVFRPPIVAPADDVLPSSIRSVWMDILVRNGLEAAVLSDKDLTTRIRDIEPTVRHWKKISLAPKPKSSGDWISPIRSLELVNFRRFPTQKCFNFGDVNLIYGPNGSGKTSLLEAIELLYCGMNKRNPDAPDSYELVATLANGSTKTETSDKHPRSFRSRNLNWYGETEMIPRGKSNVRTKSLALSFAKFNFLNTDAGVSLADSTERMEEALTKLLVGPDTAGVWQSIVLLNNYVIGILKEREELEKQYSNEIDELERKLTEAKKVKIESELIIARFEEMIKALSVSDHAEKKDMLSSRSISRVRTLITVRELKLALQSATKIETHESETFTEAEKRKLELIRKRSNLQERIKLLNEAHNTFEHIREEYSLGSAMKSAMQRNRLGIETIFSRIQSPAEFSGLGDEFGTLVRKDGGVARPDQISTGQRAAFALSIFLAFNAQLKAGPPVILIDDPIVYIDDINTLAFLDYLREIVLNGNRQIFFATANEKLATLFQRKFDFLGDAYRSFNISRE